MQSDFFVCVRLVPIIYLPISTLDYAFFKNQKIQKGHGHVECGKIKQHYCLKSKCKVELSLQEQEYSSDE